MPGGGNGQIQYNNNGSFGAVPNMLYVAPDIQISGDTKNSGTSGSITISSGQATGTASSGNVEIKTADGYNVGVIRLMAGNATGPNANGGDIVLTTGNNTGTGRPGYFFLNNLPSSNPGVANALYRIGNVVMSVNNTTEILDTIFTNLHNSGYASFISSDANNAIVVGSDAKLFASFSLPSNTKSNILASTPTAGKFYRSSDSNEFYVADGTRWQKNPFPFVPEPQNPDMGYTQNSSKIGYTSTYITNKALNNVTLGSNPVLTERGLWAISNDGYYGYIGGTTVKFVTGFRFREKDNVFQHQPVINGDWISVYSGNSERVGLNGRPIIQGYSVSMGAYPPKPVIDGGTF